MNAMTQTNGATQVPITQTHRHPTPAVIRAAITNAFLADMDNTATPYVPCHVERLVDDAISRACDKWEGRA